MWSSGGADELTRGKEDKNATFLWRRLRSGVVESGFQEKESNRLPSASV
jgi:hypothetical protein